MSPADGTMPSASGSGVWIVWADGQTTYWASEGLARAFADRSREELHSEGLHNSADRVEVAELVPLTEMPPPRSEVQPMLPFDQLDPDSQVLVELLGRREAYDREYAAERGERGGQ